MQSPAFNELILLPEREAAERHLDGRAAVGLRWLLAAAVLGAAVTGMIFATTGETFRLAFQIASLLLSLGFISIRRRPFFAAHFRPLAAAYLAVQLGLFTLAANPVMAVVLGAVIFPAALLLVTLPAAYHLLLGALFAGTALWAVLVVPGERPEGTITAQALGVLVPVAAVVAAAIARQRRERRRFVERWRREAPRERERRRMRDELADARKIQLSMLPPAAPELAWIDLASVSLPATEVGGDYFDYFPLADGGLAVVIGDVAGHGVGSGLVLAGVKSGLYLLRDRMGSPVEVIDQLNAMVRDSVRWRMFVTLLVAVLDPEGGRLRAVSAGHPPLLHFSAADGKVRELAAGAPPLGTRLRHEFHEEEVDLTPGDVVLLYTDGLTEVRSLGGEPYGEARLRRELGRAAAFPSAVEVRDALLHGLSRFKGDAPQEDDLTLVVAQMRRRPEEVTAPPGWSLTAPLEATPGEAAERRVGGESAGGG